MSGATLRNPARERMAADELALGLIVRVARSPDIARIARAAGHDFLFIDRQHAAFDIETVSAMIAAAHGCGIAPFIRVRGPNDADIPLLLDCGATGIIVPDVNTAEEAARAAKAAKFHPLGRRSLPGPLALLDFAPVPAGEATRLVNDATLLVCMVETRQGVSNAAEIAAVPGVDVVHVGAVDLLNDMGLGDAFDAPEAAEAIHHVIASARAAGKFAGVGGDREPTRLAGYIGRGARFLTTQTDAAMLMAEGARITAGLRKAKA